MALLADDDEHKLLIESRDYMTDTIASSFTVRVPGGTRTLSEACLITFILITLIYKHPHTPRPLNRRPGVPLNVYLDFSARPTPELVCAAARLILLNLARWRHFFLVISDFDDMYIAVRLIADAFSTPPLSLATSRSLARYARASCASGADPCIWLGPRRQRSATSCCAAFLSTGCLSSLLR